MLSEKKITFPYLTQAMFGSCVSGEAMAGSDLDLMVGINSNIGLNSLIW